MLWQGDAVLASVAAAGQLVARAPLLAELRHLLREEPVGREVVYVDGADVGGEPLHEGLDLARLEAELAAAPVLVPEQRAHEVLLVRGLVADEPAGLVPDGEDLHLALAELAEEVADVEPAVGQLQDPLVVEDEPVEALEGRAHLLDPARLEGRLEGPVFGHRARAEADLEPGHAAIAGLADALLEAA